MKRSGPPQRKTPLKSSGPIKPKWPPQGSREKRAKRLSRSKMPSSVADAVHRRSGGRCEYGNHAGCSGRGEHLHHRRLRSQMGPNTVENLVDICSVAHSLIHGHPEWARRHGWIVSREHEPVEIGVWPCPLDCPDDHRQVVIEARAVER